MKNKYISLLLILPFLFLYSCYDDKMEWVEVDKDSQISEGEIPLQMAEKIARYEALKNYASFNLGIGVDLATYLDNDVYASIVNENFHEVVIGYDMKHGPMVKSDGTINFDRVDAFIAKAKQNGLGVYGHTLVWHQNQNASYLNKLIAPEIIPGASGESLLDISDLKAGDFSEDWDLANPSGGISVVEGEGIGGGNAIEMIAGTVSNPWDLQLLTPSIPAIEDHTYEISFFVKSDEPGEARISFQGLDNNYPWKDWLDVGTETESFQTDATWREVKFTINDFVDLEIKIAFDFGYISDVTYYIDVNTLKVIDTDGESEAFNYLTNGKFEEDGLDGWVVYNGGDDVLSLATTPDVYQGEGAMKVEHSLNEPTDQWKVQIHSDFFDVLPEGDYTISYQIRSEAPGKVRCSTTGTARYQGDQDTGLEWTLITWDITSDGAIDGLNFDLGAVAGTYYIDNVLVTPKEVEPAPKLKSGPTYIYKTEEEMEQIIGDAMEFFITEMMKHYKDDVDAWDVVNEPMKENGQLRDGEVAELESDEFYWVKYLGEDYAVKAFKTARENAKPGDKLFINDYNLEHSIPKCEGIIDYVNYIESQGATVDGIGTQMHIGIETNKDNIREMFELLAASGKLIKVTELDIRVNTDAPSADHFEQQAEMYQYVVDTYTEVIPEAQQYGITVWGVSDHADEHEYWIPDDAPNIWDAKYQRKLSYKTFADGLAGKDISEDFTGELIIDEDDSSEEENEEEE